MFSDRWGPKWPGYWLPFWSNLQPRFPGSFRSCHTDILPLLVRDKYPPAPGSLHLLFSLCQELHFLGQTFPDCPSRLHTPFSILWPCSKFPGSSHAPSHYLFMFICLLPLPPYSILKILSVLFTCGFYCLVHRRSSTNIIEFLNK